MRIVSFDPGLNLGYAFSEITKKGFHYYDSGHIKNDSKQPIAERQQNLTDFIYQYIAMNCPDIVIVEGINRVRGSKVFKEKNESTWALHWVFGEIIRISSLQSKELLQMNPSQMKAAASHGKRSNGAKGLASKEEIMAICKDLTGKKHMRSDESDAIGLALAYYKIYTGEYIPKAKKD